MNRVRKSNIEFTEALLFGSYAKGDQHENSDIDTAIVLKDNVVHTFETDVKLMIIRKSGDETFIEPILLQKKNLIVVCLLWIKLPVSAKESPFKDTNRIAKRLNLLTGN